SEILIPDFYQLLGYTDRINPTYLFKGNADLEYGFSHKVTLKKYFSRGIRIRKSAAKKSKAYMNLELAIERQQNPIVVSVNYDSTNVPLVQYTNVLYKDQVSGMWKLTQRIGKQVKVIFKPQYQITNYGYELNDQYHTAWNNTLDVAFDVNYRLKHFQFDVMADYFNVQQEYNQGLGLMGSFEMLGIAARLKSTVKKRWTTAVFVGYNRIFNFGSSAAKSILPAEDYIKLDFSTHIKSRDERLTLGIICRDLLNQNQLLNGFTMSNSTERIIGRSQGRVVMFTVGLTLQQKRRSFPF
ncbi:MAG: hypothetical protein JKY54_10220, partial [Flavobacteriales bacterium]|nr:hypothetical protein [Flavobacteriales bacterium]